MNQQDQIKQLEESNQELKRQIELQAKQIEALKSDEERFAPYKGAGYIISMGPYQDHHTILKCGENPQRYEYYAYPTEAQVEWELKATQVRRKLQRICAVLGPAKVNEVTRDTTSVHSVRFARREDAEKAEQIIADDLKYLNWNNSPEAQDAREGRV